MSGCVFRCFKALERAGDRITGAAGPFFVAFAIILISTGAVCFFDVIAPELKFPWLSIPVCILIATNLFAHYYYVCTVPPGFIDDPPQTLGHGFIWAKKTAPRSILTGVRWSGDDQVKTTTAAVSKCKRCGELRPERAHHCRICKKCVLKYDHHCPCTILVVNHSVTMHYTHYNGIGINQCVGLYNERHFVLFLVYMVLASTCYVALGWTDFMESLGLGAYGGEPRYHVSPMAFMLIYILAIVIAFAVAIMGGWHLWSISLGETSVEGQDHEVYRKMAKGRGEDFVNSYDLGKRRNLELFFNIGPGGYPWYTLLLPLRVPPYTDGRAWARREGYHIHGGVRTGEELTDEDE